MTIKTLTRSFAGGELAPELLGRVDLVKYNTGIGANSRNFITFAHGPAANRAGTQYVLETKFSAKRSVLIPFIFNDSQAYELEFGDQYIRFHTLGGTVLEAAKNITAVTNANPGVITSVAHGFLNGDWVFLNTIGGTVQLNGRFVKVANKTANTFQINGLDDVPINTTSFGVYTAGGTAARVYELATPYLEADLFDLHYTQSNDVMTITHKSYQARELKRLGATSWTLSIVNMGPLTAVPSNLIITAVGGGAIVYQYAITAAADDGSEESFQVSGISPVNDLTVVGNHNDIESGVTTTAQFNVYKVKDGLYGFIGRAAVGAKFVDSNITPDTTITPPPFNDPFTSASNFPRAVGYFQGRRWFAGTINKPQNLWGTKSGTEYNLSFSIPPRDDDSIAVRLTARKANTIRHIVPLTDLLVFTDGEVWKISSDVEVITPSNISYQPQGSAGASNVQPVVTNGSVLYNQARGGRISEMQFSWERNGYKTTDLSLVAPHLFDKYTITSMTYSRSPHQLMWATRSDGMLLGLTYMPEQQVVGWHHHDTENGAAQFESVVAIPEGVEDVVSFIVKRTVNGRVVRYVERLHSRQFTALADAFFVDCGASYSGAPVATVGNAYFLEGKTVSILADGAVQPQQVVTNGSITLQQAASVITFGVPITADLESLPLVSEAMAAFGQGAQKNVNKVHLRVDNSSGMQVGPSFDKLKPAKQRTTEPYGSPPALKSGVISVDVTPTWSVDSPVCLRQSDPLPVTVLSMTLEVAVGG